MTARAEFDKRRSEIDEYINHLQKQEAVTGLSPTLINTMKSSAIVMIYNMIESTMTNLMQDVFDHIEKSSVDFNNLSNKMKSVVLKNCKQRNADKVVEIIRNERKTLPIATFDKTEVFSGNIDCDEIRKTFKALGASTRHRYDEPALLTIKSERNSLAHGDASFSDCGKKYSAIALAEHHAKTCSILNNAIGDFDNFIQTRAYA
jgi:hypothetical protein